MMRLVLLFYSQNVLRKLYGFKLFFEKIMIFSICFECLYIVDVSCDDYSMLVAIYSISRALCAQLKPHSVNTVNYSTAVLLLTTFILSVSHLY